MSPRARKPADPRHAAVREVLRLYWLAERNELVRDLPWSAGDAGALAAFLRANPALTVDEIKQLLRHRLRSQDHARGEPVKLWIGALTRYANGPLNKFKQPTQRTEGGHHAQQPTRADERFQRAQDATAAALERVRRLADNQAR